MHWNPLLGLSCMTLLCSCSAVDQQLADAPDVTVQSSPNTAHNEQAISQIKELERRWSEAFVSKDYGFIEDIVAPDFMLVVFEGEPILVPRKYWMMNTRKWDIQNFSENVLDVVVKGNTAVATVEGNWRVVDDGKLIRDDSFFLTDTWVHSSDGWQIVRRHSQTTENRLRPD